MGWWKAELQIVALAAVCGALSGCLTDAELVREERRQERLRLQEMVANGECRERPRTGQRTRMVYECGEVNDEQVTTAQESVRRIQNQGAICGGANC
ncbi:hypothetical protein [Maricaulis parjimensis]|uniref:hypothetical protein n=1 Tax=Maricaulis parjimensis TaxID=144023 RepID=UPI00193A1237|nr:hypothetical protein [Maricaulis parjimensis]